MNTFEKHLLNVSRKFNLPYALEKHSLRKLCLNNCSFCDIQETPKTYQNVGLVVFKNGYISSNVFPLCKMCYTTRAGLNKKKYINTCKTICGKRIKLQEIGKYISSHSEERKCKYSNQFTCSDRRKLFTKNPNCAYCKRNTNLTVNRINSNKTYSKGNVQVLCWLCNRMKGKHNEKLFLKHCRRISLII